MTAFDTSPPDQAQLDEADFDSLSTSSLESASSGKPRPLIYRCCSFKETSPIPDGKESTNYCPTFSTACCHQELEQERIAAESAANEAISMILRLQAEKATLQIEARYYQELFEARSLYDEQTISQLRHVICSQEADILSLERECEECKQALHILSDYMQENFRPPPFLKEKDNCRISSIKVGAVLELYSRKGRFKHRSAEKNCGCSTVHSGENTQQKQLTPSNDLKGEDKTKRLVSTISSNPLCNGSLRDITLEADALSQDACLAMVDEYLRSLELEGDRVANNGKWFGNLDGECWLAILIPSLNLQNHILSLGLSNTQAHNVQDNCLAYGLNYSDDSCTDTCRDILSDTCLQNAFHWNTCGVSKVCLSKGFDSGENKMHAALDSYLHISGLMKVGKEIDLPHSCNKEVDRLEQQEKLVHIHIDPLIERLTRIDKCLEHLEKQFALFRSRLHGLEDSRTAIVEAVKMIPQNQGILEITVLEASNMLKECYSLTDSACDILGIVQKLVMSLTKVSKIEERHANTNMGSQSKVDRGRMQENTHAASEELPGTALTVTQGDSPQSLWSTLSTLAFEWSSSLDWLSNERCRAETALSGWDHV